MSSLIKNRFSRNMSQVAVLSLLASGAVGCSSDFTRFDKNLYEALPQSASQTSGNPYPGDVDRTTTASIGKGQPVPVGAVQAPRAISDDGNYRPAALSNNVVNNSVGQQSAYRPAPSYNSGIVKSELPQPKMNSSLASPAASGVVTAPKLASNISNSVDNAKTGSISAPKVSAPSINTAKAAVTQQATSVAVDQVSNGVGGWSGAGGTSITLKQGETLYNLSKRYGVPVQELVRVNGLSSATAISAGQRLTIPTYVYSQNAPVSSPDSNPLTKSARSTVGQLGEADPARVPVPTKNPQQMASAVTDTAPPDPSLQERYKPAPRASDPNLEQNAPDYSVVTGSVSGKNASSSHVVVSGDTLSKIATQNGTTVSALMEANGLSSSSLKIGQRLVMPGASQQVAQNSVPVNVDPIVTGGTAKAETPKGYTKPEVDQTITNSAAAKAPERTGIESFRWPVEGRVISSFGDKRGAQVNDGIDISVPEGTAVKAAENGVVIYAGSELEGFGNLVLIRHEGGYVTAYAHNKSNGVAKGDTVRRGQVIANSGRTGGATVPMLHFEIRKDSKPVNPTKYLSS